MATTPDRRGVPTGNAKDTLNPVPVGPAHSPILDAAKAAAVAEHQRRSSTATAA